ncbi:MAG: hypothetical protein KDB53_05040 [Planctomycetes bacterium]|nr:hypothetical protein [Planctomycetota bacterium]
MASQDVAARRMGQWLRRIRKVIYLAILGGIALFVWRYDLFTVPGDYQLLAPQHIEPGTKLVMQDVDEGTVIGVGTILSYAPPGFDGQCLGVVAGLPGETIQIAADAAGWVKLVVGGRAERLAVPATHALVEGTIPVDQFLILNGDRRIMAEASTDHPDSRRFGLIARSALRQKVVAPLWGFF